MKHLEFKRKYADLLLNGKKRSTIRNRTNLKEGDEVYVHCGGKIIGKAKIISVERKKVSELTDDDAKLDGFESVDKMLMEIRRMGYGDEVHIIRFDFEPFNAVNPHNMYYGDVDLVEIAEKSLRHLNLTEREKEILKIFLKYGSIRRAATKLGGHKKRGLIRNLLRTCYLRLKEEGRI